LDTWRLGGFAPAEFYDAEGICVAGVHEIQILNIGSLTRGLTQGVKTSEFESIPVKHTASLLIVSRKTLCLTHG